MAVSFTKTTVKFMIREMMFFIVFFLLLKVMVDFRTVILSDNTFNIAHFENFASGETKISSKKIPSAGSRSKMPQIRLFFSGCFNRFVYPQKVFSPNFRDTLSYFTVVFLK